MRFGSLMACYAERRTPAAPRRERTAWHKDGIAGSGCICLLGRFRLGLPNPQPVSIWIFDSKFLHAIKCNVQVRDHQSSGAHLLVILFDVLGIEIQNRLPRSLWTTVNGLVNHHAASIEAEHGPSPTIFPALNVESQL